MEKEEIIQKILKESRLRDKKKEGKPLEENDLEVVKLIADYRNKTDLANKFLKFVPLYFDNSNLWWRWIYRNSRWELTDEVDVLNLIEGCSHADIIKSKERTEILNAVKQIARRKKPKEPKLTWIQFNNEVIDLDTGERFEATPEYFVTNPIPFNLGKNIDTPIMDKIFGQWVGKKYVKTLYEIISYCLLPDYPLHRLFCFIGSGMNGKSCFLNLLRKFIGEYNVCATELDILINSRFEVTRLHKKLVCQMGETNFNEMSKTSIIKKLTGNDLIGFEYKNKNPFEEKNYAKIIIATNNLPTTTDKTIGFYRRWLIIDFPNKFSEKKEILNIIPEEEYENLCMKCIGLLIDLLKKREFYKEGSVEDRMKKYESKSDFLQKFLDEFTEESINAFITKADFRKKFASWCKENRHREMADNTLSKNMKKKEIEPGKRHFGWLNEGKGGQLPVYLDIKWKE